MALALANKGNLAPAPNTTHLFFQIAGRSPLRRTLTKSTEESQEVTIWVCDYKLPIAQFNLLVSVPALFEWDPERQCRSNNVGVQ